MYRTLIVIMLVAVLSGNATANRPTAELTPKSPELAAMLSLAGTVVPLTMGWRSLANRGDGSALPGALWLFAGSVIGPGLGHAYAGNSRKCFMGAGIRLAIGGGTLMMAVASADDSSFGPSPGTAIALLLGTGAAGISCIYDIATAPRSADQFNRKHGLANISVQPTYDFADNTAGLQLSLRF